MTRTTTSRRRLAAAVSVLAAVAVLAGPLPTAAASASAQATPMAAKSKAVKAAKTTVPATRPAAAVAAANDFSSIFASQAPALTNSGWATCASAVTWSVDTSGLTASQATREIENLTWALGEWSQATGLSFQFTGTTALAYNDSAFTLRPAGGTAASRHIYLAFVSDSDSDRMNRTTVGLGSPSAVLPGSKEIVTGTAVFQTEHVAKAGVREARSLYLHELGHVFGLAHADETANIMYPVVTDHLELGVGDVHGVQTMSKPCTAGA